MPLGPEEVVREDHADPPRAVRAVGIASALPGLEEGWHFSCERETIMERQIHFQRSIFSRATENGPAFVNVLCVQTSTQRSAGPLVSVQKVFGRKRVGINLEDILSGFDLATAQTMIREAEQFYEDGAKLPPGPQINIQAWVFCMSWCADLAFLVWVPAGKHDGVFDHQLNFEEYFKAIVECTGPRACSRDKAHFHFSRAHWRALGKRLILSQVAIDETVILLTLSLHHY